MLLAIDAGNTNVVFAVVTPSGEVRCEWRATSDSGRTADEYAVWLTSLMVLDGIKPADIDACIIATVVPQGLFNLRTLCRRYFQTEPMVVGEGIDLGLSVALADPNQVGADRLVNAVAAHQSYGGDMIIVDFGTATTFDVVGSDGSYQGGVIAPGVNLSLEALHMAAAKLPRIAFGAPEQVIGKSTIPAMQSGIFWGYVGLIEGLCARIKQEYGKEMRVIATGGLANLFATGTKVIDEIDRDLTIRGLSMIYQRNRASFDHKVVT